MRQRQEIQALLLPRIKGTNMSSQPRLAASEFQTILDELLTGASRQGLEHWIRERSEGLSSRERQPFLDDLAASLDESRFRYPRPGTC